MPTPIRVLIVEDAEADARLIVRELRQGGYAPTWLRVETADTMRAALREQAWDIVLSDYKMPHFSGPAALTVLHESGRDLPFIVVSGTIGEENAVAMMKAGAHDYILKENLTRLAPAIAREIREAKVRRARRQDAMRNTILMELYAKAPRLTEQALYAFALDQAVALTDSTIGFLHRISDDQQTILLTAWNREALQTCTASYETHYPVAQAGNWVDCLRVKQPVVYNDYPTSPHRKGMPEGHTPIHRFMSIPVLEGDTVRLIVGVGNKADPYEDQDVVQLQLVANELQKILSQRHAEEAFERERAYLASAIDLLPFPIVFIDQERQVFRANRASEMMLATRDHEQWLDLPLLLPETHLEIPLAQRPAARALRGEVVTAFEGILRTPSDQELPLLLYAAPITIGSDVVAAVIAFQDISVLKEADRAKNQFLNVISHEMRTPLTAILGWAQLAESDPALCADALHAIHQSAQAQHATLERLILLSRILTGKLTLQRQAADLWELADQVATASQLRAQERQITLQCNPPAEPLPVSVDPKLMRQALQEMLDNALKYTVVGGQVTVSATRMEGQAVVAVHDTGQGIALEDLPKLWKPFQQVVREERLGGLGIGLVLLRGIVEAHGGQVFIVSPGLEQGSTFSISIALVLPLPGPPDSGA
jgi:signal transduction histidine kinase/DNA-binding response OmpR family regulator